MKDMPFKIKLSHSHTSFILYINSLTKEEYDFSYQKKWNAGQHLEHILKSVSILNKALILPKWFLKYKFGFANRPSKTKEKLIERYLEKLKTAKPTPNRFQPSEITFNEKKKNIQLLKKQVTKLTKRIERFSNHDLDYYILPHPLLGKVTLKEMLFFTNYHVQHHLELIQFALKNKQL